jgi:hypothetical protein
MSPSSTTSTKLPDGVIRHHEGAVTIGFLANFGSRERTQKVSQSSATASSGSTRRWPT